VEPWGTGAFEDTLEQARCGDELAFAQLWRWLNPSLLRWLGVVVPGADDDVASEVWLSVVRGLDEFSGGEREFRAWVFVVARRRATDWVRKRRRRPVTVGLSDVEVVQLHDASAGVLEDEAIAYTMALLAPLAPDQAEVISLRVLAGLTVAETAVVVEKSEGAVRILCHRGLRALAGQLAEVDLARGVTK